MDDDQTIVTESRVPELLYEIIHEGIHLIQMNNISQATENFSHCENVIESVITQDGYVDTTQIVIVLHNLAYLHYIQGNYSDASNYIAGWIFNWQRDTIFNKKENPSAGKIQSCYYEAKLNIQKITILNEAKTPENALQHAKTAVKHLHRIIQELLKLSRGHIIKSKKFNGKKSRTQALAETQPAVSPKEAIFNEQVQNVIPIIEHIDRLLINKKLRRGAKAPKFDLRSVLGVNHNKDWISTIKLAEIITPRHINPGDLDPVKGQYGHFTSDAICTLVCHLAVSYYVVSDCLVSEADVNALKIKEAEIWHSRSKEICRTFLPQDVPLVGELKSLYTATFQRRKAVTPTFKRPVSRNRRPMELRLNKAKKEPNLNISYENTMNSPYKTTRRKTPVRNTKNEKITFQATRPRTAQANPRKQSIKPSKKSKRVTPQPLLKTDLMKQPSEVSLTQAAKRGVIQLNVRESKEDQKSVEEDEFGLTSEDLYGNYTYESSDSESSVRYIEEKELPSIRISSSTGGKS